MDQGQMQCQAFKSLEINLVISEKELRIELGRAREGGEEKERSRLIKKREK